MTVSGLITTLLCLGFQRASLVKPAAFREVVNATAVHTAISSLKRGDRVELTLVSSAPIPRSMSVVM